MSPRRIQLQRTKGWRLPAGAVSVARPSRWGNPFKVGDPLEVRAIGYMLGGSAGYYDPGDIRSYDTTLPPDSVTPQMAVDLYQADLVATLATPDPYYDDLREDLAALRGKDLACWCPLDQPCHADVLLELANRRLP